VEKNGYNFNRIPPIGETADNREELSPVEVQAVVDASKISKIQEGHRDP
jgi:hypothetical protein